MATQKRLSSVCHSTAHHAVSGLSYLHPHLRQACRLANLSNVTVELLAENPYPHNLVHLQPLFLALAALKVKFTEILNSEGFAVEDLQSATLRFEFEPKFTDDFSSNCFAQLVSMNGKAYEHFVDYLGNSIKPETSIRL